MDIVSQLSLAQVSTSCHGRYAQNAQFLNSLLQ